MTEKYSPFNNQSIAEIFNNYPESVQSKMYELRELIIQTASDLEVVNKLEETLKWGEPSYIASNPATGTTIRIDWKEKNPAYYGLYVGCRTSLINTFRTQHPHALKYDGNRAILLSVEDDLSNDEQKLSLIKVFIRMTLTYKLKK